MELRGVIFDLDGTLGDTLPICFIAYRRCLEEFKGISYTDKEITGMFGPSEVGIIQKQVPERWRECLDFHLAVYDQEHVACREPFPGVDEALRLLKERGILMAIVTGKGPKACEISLRHLGISDYFDAVETGGTEGGIKPLSMRLIMEKWGLSPESIAYVGDAPYDMEAAKEAGVLALAAAWAETADPESLSAKNPDAVFRSVDEFMGWIKANTGR